MARSRPHAAPVSANGRPRPAAIRVLLVEDDATDALWACAELANATDPVFEVVQVARLKAALDRVARESFDVVLLDLGLPDSDGLATFTRLRAAAPMVPVVVLSHPTEELFAIDAVQAGAQDCLLKGRAEGLLARATRHAIERANAALKLATSERRLRAIIETEPECVKLLAADGRVLEMNAAGLRMIEVDSFQQIAQRCVYSLVAAPDRAAFQALNEAVFAGGSGVLEFRIVGFKGGQRTLETHASPLRDEAGQVTAALGITRDITERKRAERLLRDKEHLLSEAERIAHLGSWSWEFSSGEIRWSDETYRLYGVTPETFDPDTALPDSVHPEDRPILRAWIDNCLAGIPPGDLELRVRLPAGGVRILQGRGDFQTAASGRPAGMLGTVLDITERKRSDAALRAAAARYRKLFDANPHPMWIFDPETLRFLAVNDTAVQRYGYTRDEFLAMTLRDIRPPEDVPALLESVRDRPVFRSSPWRHRTKDGRIIEAEITTQPFDFDGRAARVVLAHDVTEQRRAAREVQDSRQSLRRLLERLQRAQDEERTRISREIHDELGQLLTGLKMDLRWLERKLSEPGLPPALNGLLDRTVAASALNEQTLVTVRKLAAELRPGALDQLGLAAALAQRTRQFQERSGVACSLHVTEPLSPLPPVVASELFYICQEALTNVARHAQATRVTVGLRADAGGVWMEVADDGIGTDAALVVAPHSLGMLGMRERAWRCNGTVEIESSAGGGTRLVVRLAPLDAAGMAASRCAS